MIPIIDLFEKKNTDIYLASGTLEEMKNLAARLNCDLLKLICVSEENDLYDLYIDINIQIYINNRPINIDGGEN